MNLVEAEIADGQVEFAGVRLPLPPGDIRARQGDPGDPPAGLLARRSADPALPDDRRSSRRWSRSSARRRTRSSRSTRRRSTAKRSGRRPTKATRACCSRRDRRALFTASLPEGTEVVIGKPLRLALNPARLHFFDPETGARLDHATQVA